MLHIFVPMLTYHPAIRPSDLKCFLTLPWQEAEHLVNSKIHPQTIIAGWRMATDCARAALTATAKDNSGDPTKFKEVLVLMFPSYMMRVYDVSCLCVICFFVWSVSYTSFLSISSIHVASVLCTYVSIVICALCYDVMLGGLWSASCGLLHICTCS